MRKVLLLLSIPLGVFSQQPKLTPELADRLAALPLKCIGQQWPNKTSHTSDTLTDHVLLPADLHPAFYGCFDWHSSVHGHWMLVKLLKVYPQFSQAAKASEVLANSFTADKLKAEAAYFTKYKTSYAYERTYGWAWLLKLDNELKSWNDVRAKEWYTNLKPLTAAIVTEWKKFLPKQTYPNRTGVHPNTAFGLCFALDWARENKDVEFEKLIIEKSKEYYLANTQIPAWLEPDGSDFFSPSLEVADLMQRILSQKEFTAWLDKYYTQKGIENLLSPPHISDHNDFQIVHLDGLSLSRSWCLRNISDKLPAGHKWKNLFATKAGELLNSGLPAVTSGNYGGDHWLASFAVHALFN